MSLDTKRYVGIALLVVIGSMCSTLFFLRTQAGPLPAPERYPVLEQDSSMYATLADNLLVHHSFSASPDLTPFRKWAIGYPLFLAVTKSISGGFWLAVLLQILLSAFAAVLLYKMARSLLSPSLALVPTLLFALNPYVLFLNSTILSDGLFTSLIICIVYLLFFSTYEKKIHIIGIGALLGIATLVRPIAQFLVIVLPILYIWHKHLSFKHAWRIAAVFIAGFGIIVIPWVTRNALTFGTPEVAHISSFDLLFYDAQSFLLFKELRAVRPQPILLASSPLYTPEAKAASQRVSDRIEHDLARLTPAGGDPENYYGKLALEYILENPFQYGYFHIVNTLPFFLQGDIRGYAIQARSIAAQNGTYTAPVSLFEAWHSLIGRTSTLGIRLQSFGTLFAPGFELGFNVLVVLLSLASILLVRNRLLSVLAILVAYFALLTGPVGIDTPRLHVPAEPFLFLLASVGITASISVLHTLYTHRREFGRFLIAGGSTTALDLLLLYGATEYMHLHYLISASIALVIAYTTSFFLQKLWAFRDESKNHMTTQALGYSVFVVASIALNALLLWFFVHELFLWYVAAQILVSLILALMSYVLYKKILFGKHSVDSVQFPEARV